MLVRTLYLFFLLAVSGFVAAEPLAVSPGSNAMSFRVLSFGDYSQSMSSIGLRHITGAGNGLLVGMGYISYTDRDDERSEDSFGIDYNKREFRRDSIYLSFNFRDYLQSDAIHYFLDYGVYYLYSSYKNNYLSQTSSGSVSYYDSDRYHSNGIGFGFGFGAEYALSKRVSIDAKMIASYSYSEKNGSNKGEQWDFRIGSTALGINFYW